MSLTTIRNQALTVVISTLGAELQSVKDANGVERLWQGDPKFWASRAPILFPVAGGFREDCYELDGKRYPMPKHGFVRKLEWQLESAREDSATMMINQKDEGFPFAYELRAIFTLEGASLKVTYQVDNKDDKPFWFSVGSHEAYATPEGFEHYEIVFDEEEKLENYLLDGNLIRPKPVVLGQQTHVLALKPDYFSVDALVLPTLKSRAVTLRTPLHNREIRVEYPQHGVLMLWTKPGAGYLCIEPWCNAPDFVDADLHIDRKPGFMRLTPGETIARTHTITVK